MVDVEARDNNRLGVKTLQALDRAFHREGDAVERNHSNNSVSISICCAKKMYRLFFPRGSCSEEMLKGGMTIVKNAQGNIIETKVNDSVLNISRTGTFGIRNGSISN